MLNILKFIPSFFILYLCYQVRMIKTLVIKNILYLCYQVTMIKTLVIENIRSDDVGGLYKPTHNPL